VRDRLPRNVAGDSAINGDCAQGAAGVMNIGIASLSTFDRLIVSGNTTLCGTLNIFFTDGYEPSVSDSALAFDFLSTGGSLTGFFQTVNVSGGSHRVATRRTSNKVRREAGSRCRW
jgi:hypothetical protein